MKRTLSSSVLAMAGCTPFQNGGNCFGTFHFTIHRVKANVPN